MTKAMLMSLTCRPSRTGVRSDSLKARQFLGCSICSTRLCASVRSAKEHLVSSEYALFACTADLEVGGCMTAMLHNIVLSALVVENTILV